MKQELLQLKFEARALMAREPRLAPLQRLVVWWTQYKMRGLIPLHECRVGPRTEFVLDGFQGSGNSFATKAFKVSQTQPVVLAHHLHAPAQIIKAVQRGLPTLVTIRKPAGVAPSLSSRWPYVSVAQALRSYVRFYEKLEPYLGGFVLSPFDQTTRHFDKVVEEVNRRFGRDFDVFEPTEANIRALRNPAKLNSKPELEREALKARKAKALQQPDAAVWLRKAEAVYARLEPHGVGR